MRKSHVLHPFILSIYPIVFLFSQNVHRASLPDVLIPSVISLFGSVILLLLSSLIIKDIRKAGMITSFLICCFYSFGHLHDGLREITDKLGYGHGLLRYRYLMSIYAIAAIGFTIAVIKLKRRLINTTRVLNYISIFLIVLSAGSIVYFYIKTIGQPDISKNNDFHSEIVTGDNNELPDIYYIILDAYTDSKTLKDIYGYDNSDFLNYLKEKGFFIPLNGRSNYMATRFSLPSSLNMSYLDNAIKSTVSDQANKVILDKLTQNSAVVSFLRSKGYKFINFCSGWASTDYNRHADINVNQLNYINEFTNVLLHTTVLESFSSIFGRFNSKRRRIYATFYKLPQQARIAGPKFTLVHLITPHPPDIFDEKGDPIPAKADDFFTIIPENYIKELKFINKKMEFLIDELLKESKTPPIIIIQADHGTWSLLPHPFRDPDGWDKPTPDTARERTGILNAYYVKNKCRNLLYDNITPVNSFRVIFNCYFGTNFELLQDRYFWSNFKGSYIFEDVTQMVAGNKERENPFK